MQIICFKRSRAAVPLPLVFRPTLLSWPYDRHADSDYWGRYLRYWHLGYWCWWPCSHGWVDEAMALQADQACAQKGYDY